MSEKHKDDTPDDKTPPREDKMQWQGDEGLTVIPPPSHDTTAADFKDTEWPA